MSFVLYFKENREETVSYINFCFEIFHKEGKSMQLFTFKGGIHPPHRKKQTENMPATKAKPPGVVYIPLLQHIGAPCVPVVSKGEYVKVGQKIGEAQGFVSIPVHSSVSGTVQALKEMPLQGGTKVLCVVIENDFKDELHESVTPKGDLSELSPEEIIQMIKEAGIAGMGGAAFPTHVKLSPPSEKNVDTVVLNGAECEPYLTADHRLMLEMPGDVIDGARAIMKALGISRAYIGIEDNKKDVINGLRNEIKDGEDINIVLLKTKYPQGAEKQLIYACTGRMVPSGGLPMDAGVVVNNVATAAQIARTIKTGMPSIERITTVTGGAINSPQNLIVKIGTLYSDLIDECGGFKEEPSKVISGGPMMGLAQSSVHIPVTKGTSGILCLTKEEAKRPEPENCIRCGRCFTVCPVNLQPLYISAHSLKYDYKKAEEYRAMDCIECGSCSFICPSKRPLLESIRVAKREIVASRRKAK